MRGARPNQCAAGTQAWCDRLEAAPGDTIVGKVLCVCAASAIARTVIINAATAAGGGDSASLRALDLLEAWIDDPTEDRFQAITTLIFPAEQSADIGPHGVGSWALRTATAAPGCAEAGWALAATCEAAQAAGLTPADLRQIARRAILARRKQP